MFLRPRKEKARSLPKVGIVTLLYLQTWGEKWAKNGVTAVSQVTVSGG
jgi:hypothetical protein